MATLAELLAVAEGIVQRPLLDDEVVMVSRMQATGSDAAEIVKMFSAPTPEATGETVRRYEPSGPGTARRIP